MFYSIGLRALAAITVCVFVGSAHAADSQVERGKYLVQIAGCTDCHTPGHFFAHPDMNRFLGGSDVGFGIPGHGVFVGPNLTSDKETGLGKWTLPQIVAAITSGERPDGRILAPAMPWRGYANLTKSDALAIATFLKSLPPVSNKVAGPFGPDEQPNIFVMSVQPGRVYTSQKPPRP
jgi:mono/diheme cytochrome c family protein